MGGIVLMNLKNSIMERIHTRTQGIDDKSKVSYLCTLLHDTLAYLSEEELNEVKNWVEEEL